MPFHLGEKGTAEKAGRSLYTPLRKNYCHYLNPVPDKIFVFFLLLRIGFMKLGRMQHLPEHDPGKVKIESYKELSSFFKI